jgi:secreted trypsin-like serine protease
MSRLVVLALLFQSIFQVRAIFNGTEAAPNQFPYTVKISTIFGSGTGVIISERFVLTAAHVLEHYHFKKKVVFVLAGVYNLNDKSTSMYMESYNIIVHENFSMPAAVNDIAIIVLPRVLKFSESIQPIKIETKMNVELDNSDNEIVVSGWGFKDFYKSTDLLLFATMKLVSYEECLKYKSYYTETLTRRNICTVRIGGMPCNGELIWFV